MCFKRLNARALLFELIVVHAPLRAVRGIMINDIT